MNEKLFRPSDLIWTKNILRDGGERWAYNEWTYDSVQDLHWSTQGRAASIQPGEIVLLFQKPNRINGRRNYSVRLTHLVTPVDSNIYNYDREGYNFGRKVFVVAQANPIEAIPNPGNLDFFLPNRGSTNPLTSIVTRNGLSEVELQNQIWQLFSPCFNPTLVIVDAAPPPEISDFSAQEGDILLRQHQRQEYRQRNSAIVRLAKALALQRGGGRIRCECCSFDFLARYGQHGSAFIECHHTIPIATGGVRTTTINQLAMVCANCHRMLHRKNENDAYYGVGELKTILQDT